MKKYIPFCLAAPLLFACFAPAFAQTPTPAPAPDGFTASHAWFGIHLIQEVSREKPGRTLLLSPFSAAMALGMVYNGALGDTQQEIAGALGWDKMDPADVSQRCKLTLDSLMAVDPSVTLDIADSLWGDQAKLQFKPEFIQANQLYFGAEANLFDFSKADAVGLINQWVSDKTRGKIQNLLAQLTPEEQLVLVNAVYFKGTWASKFNGKDTQPAPFHLADGTSPDRPFMHQTQKFDYLETGDFKAVKLPYGNGRLELLVFLPSENSTLGNFLSALTPEQWGQWMGQWRNGRKVVLSLPKFKIEFTQDLVQPLQALGMRKGFLPQATDFGAMAVIDPKLETLNISQAAQKTYMLVDEEGTEAAAATHVVVRHHMMGMIKEPPPFIMTVDRPYFIALVDSKTRAILFAGAVYDPPQP